MNKIINYVAVLVVLAGTAAFGSPVLFLENFNDGGNSGWDYQVTGSGDTVDYVLSNPGGALQMTMPDNENPAVRIFAGTTGDAANFTGNYSSFVSTLNGQGKSLLVSFNLTSLDTPNTTPNSMNLYFSANGNVYTLNKAFTQPNMGQTLTYSAVIGLTGWTLAQGTPGQFAIDFTDVEQFGIELKGTVLAETHSYQLLDFELQEIVVTPEPETVWMILMVLASLGITFRSRLMELAGQVKARIRA